MGFIKLYRCLLKWEWYTDVPVKVLFVHLLLKSNYQPFEWRGEDYFAGQLICSLSSLSSDTGLSLQQVRTALQKLQNSGEVVRKNCGKFTVITVKNWQEYQTVVPCNTKITQFERPKKTLKKGSKYSYSGPDLELFERMLNVDE